MHFLEQGRKELSWLGIDYEAADRKFLGKNMNIGTDMTKYTDFPIVHLKGDILNIIACGKRRPGRDIKVWNVSELQSVFNEAVNNSVGEYPVVIGISDDKVVYNFGIKDVGYLRSNMSEFIGLLRDGFHVNVVAPVIKPTDYEAFKHRVDTLMDVNQLYVPTHDGVPALWLNEEAYVCVAHGLQKNVSDGFSTADIKHYFGLSKKYDSDKIVVTSWRTLPGQDVKFMYNSHYQHFNGSLPYSVLLYPVFARVWEQLVKAGGCQQAYENWVMWHQTGGISEATFIGNKPEPKPTAPTTEPVVTATDDSVGKWNVVEDKAPYDGKTPAVQCKLDAIDTVSAVLIQRSVMYPGTPLEIEVFDPKRNKITNFEFAPAEGVKVIGHSFEVTKALMAAIVDKGINVDVSYVTKYGVK